MDDMKSENIKSEGGGGARKDEFKLFVGGLSYKMDDAGLREGARYHAQHSVSLISQDAIPVLSLQVMFPAQNADPLPNCQLRTFPAFEVVVTHTTLC